MLPQLLCVPMLLFYSYPSAFFTRLWAPLGECLALGRNLISVCRMRLRWAMIWAFPLLGEISMAADLEPSPNCGFILQFDWIVSVPSREKLLMALPQSSTHCSIKPVLWREIYLPCDCERNAHDAQSLSLVFNSCLRLILALWVLFPLRKSDISGWTWC